jgi:hypothetical protein
VPLTLSRGAATVDARGTACSSQPRVAAILPRGEAIRNFVYSGALDAVQEQAELSVLSVMPTEDVRQLLASRYPDVHTLRHYPEHWLVGVLRELLDTAHGRYLWSKAAQDRWHIRDLEADRPWKRVKRILKKLLGCAFAHPSGLEALSACERHVSRRLRTTEEYVRLFKRVRPTLVFNGSHVHSQVAIQAVQAAQWLGIPTATFIFSWDNLTSQGRIIPSYDWYLVWSERIRQDLLRIYPTLNPEQVKVTGTPQFDFHFRPEFHWTREQFCEKVGADPDRPLILYSTGMANHMPGEPRIVEDLADALQGLGQLGPPQLLVRVYPKDLTRRFDELKRRRKDILFPTIAWDPEWLTPREEDLYLLTNTLRYCSMGINIASTISLELCMFGKPALNVAYDPPGADPGHLPFARFYEFDHYKPLVDSGAIEVAHSANELKSLIESALRNPERNAAKRQTLLEALFSGTLDGRSGERVASALLEIAGV